VRAAGAGRGRRRRRPYRRGPPRVRAAGRGDETLARGEARRGHQRRTAQGAVRRLARPTHHGRISRMKTPLVALAALLLAGCTLHYRESYLVSPQPTPAPELEALRADFPGHGFEEQRIGVPGASLYALAMTRPDARATVLYFGGNGFRIGRWIRHSAPAWGELPVDVVFVDHRGYGASTGEPGIGALMDDAVAVYDHVAAWSAGRGRPVIVHGQSLGSFMAGRVAAERRLDGLVLESSATTTEEWVEYQRSRLPWWQ